MATYGINDKLEKVKIIELTGSVSVSASSLSSVYWNSTALENAGIETVHLGDYAVLDCQYKIGTSKIWNVNRGLVVSGVVAPYVQIDTDLTQISAAIYNEDSSAVTIYVKVRLIKVAEYE